MLRNMSAAENHRKPRSKKLVIAAVVLGLFIAFDIALFGWLIVNTLSQRFMERALLETREEAAPLARELEAEADKLGQADLWVVVSTVQERQTYSRNLELLQQREFVRGVEIRDPEGTVVYKESREETLPADGGEVRTVTRVDVGELPEAWGAEGPFFEEVQIPIGELGTLVVGISREQLERRIGGLRRELLGQASLIGGLTLVLLAVAYVAVWRLFLRTRQLEEQAREAERMAYVGTLASGLAHEIRSPLNSLSLNMQMLEEEARETGGSASSSRLLSITRSEIRRLENLAGDFLSYARPSAVERREVTARELLERVIAVLAAEIGDHAAEVTLDDRSGGARVEVDDAQIGQLLLNLTQNALAAVAGRPRPQVQLVARIESPDEVVLEVIDNGPGIPPSEREQVFELFYSQRKGGTGLGLAIARRIAEAHDAILEIDQAPGGGAVLRLRLPVAMGEEESTTVTAEIPIQGFAGQR